MTKLIEFTLGSLAELLELELIGESEITISGLATLSSATIGQISFYSNSRYLQDLKSSNASAVIIDDASVDLFSGNKLISSNPYLSYAKISQLFDQRHGGINNELGDIHPSAVIHPSAKVSQNVEIKPNSVIGKNVTLDAGVKIGANCVIEDDSQIGAGSILHNNVSIYSKVSIGANVIIHSGSVIGADGFGFALDGEKYLKIAQLGSVEIGDNVEIGAGSTIDRGALDNTIIASGVKIDNQVQIAHNVKIGENCIICGCSAIAGSSTLGKNCIIAGGVGIINNLDITDNVTITAMSLVNQSIDQKGVYSSGTGIVESKLWRKNIVHFKQLGEIAKRLRKLELFNKT